MKKLFLLSLFCLASSICVNAQRFALIDMEYILENIPEYKQVCDHLDQLSQQYQKEVEAKAKEAENLYKVYQQKSASYNSTTRTQKEEEIVAKEKEAAELRLKHFGPEGTMAKKQAELISPIEDKVYEAVKQISLQYNYDVILDRASATSIIFASPKIDISNEILSKLGYSN